MPSASDSEYVGGAQSTSGHEINMNEDGRIYRKTQCMDKLQRNVSLASVLLLIYAQEPSGYLIRYYCYVS